MIAPHKEGGVLTKLLMNFLRQVLNLPYPENDNILGYVTRVPESFQLNHHHL
jgi:hypothetical protein